MARRKPPAASEPSLFDLPTPVEEEEESDWEEVPAARFNSWSDQEQLLYCAARDIDAVAYAASLEEAEWLHERAESYRRMAKGANA